MSHVKRHELNNSFTFLISLIEISVPFLFLQLLKLIFSFHPIAAPSTRELLTSVSGHHNNGGEIMRRCVFNFPRVSTEQGPESLNRT